MRTGDSGAAERGTLGKQLAAVLVEGASAASAPNEGLGLVVANGAAEGRLRAFLQCDGAPGADHETLTE
jgi:hypothetical protein